MWSNRLVKILTDGLINVHLSRLCQLWSIDVLANSIGSCLTHTDYLAITERGSKKCVCVYIHISIHICLHMIYTYVYIYVWFSNLFEPKYSHQDVVLYCPTKSGMFVSVDGINVFGCCHLHRQQRTKPFVMSCDLRYAVEIWNQNTRTYSFFQPSSSIFRRPATSPKLSHAILFSETLPWKVLSFFVVSTEAQNELVCIMIKYKVSLVSGKYGWYNCTLLNVSWAR